MAEIILKDLVKKYDNDIEVLHKINLDIESGEFMVLVGPSGCAKSTTLRLIAGLEEISSGEIIVDGEVINSIPPQNRDISLVFQSYALYPHMNVYQNMAFALKIRGLSKREIDSRINYIAKELEISNLLKRKPNELSGGQKQRVALGRSIVRHPKIFLLDEPLSNLDAKLKVSTRFLISKLHKKLPNTTMIYVTHDQMEAMTLGDRICVMNSGKIMQVDTPINIYRKPKNKFVASFIGSPTMNFIDGKIIKGGENLFFTFNGFKLILNSNFLAPLNRYINKEVTLGIRPEDIQIDLNEFSNREFLIEVENIENMGSEIYAYFKLGDFNLKLKSQNLNIKKNSKLNILFNLENISIFDIDSEENILYTY